MKKYLLLLITIFSLNVVIGQTESYLKGIAKADTNFYKVKEAGDLYFGQDSVLRDGNKYGYKEYLRWVNFFNERVFNEPGNIGNIKKYYELIQQYSDTRTLTCNNPLGLNYQWNFLGPQNLTDQYLGMITSATFFDDGVNKTIYVGSAAGGVFKTTDLGANANWTCITDDLLLPGIGFSDLRVLDDPTNNKRYLFAGTGLLHRGYGIGILRLDLLNSNAVWDEVTGLHQQGGGVLQSVVYQVVLHPTEKNRLFALIGNKLYESLNHGDSWIEVFSGNSNHQFSKMIFHPADPSIMYISTFSTSVCSAPPVIWKSSNNGVSWSILSASLNIPVSGRIDISTSQNLLESSDPNSDPLFCVVSEVLDCSNSMYGNISYFFEYDNSINEFIEVANTNPGDSYITRHCFELSKMHFTTDGSSIYPRFYFGTLGFQKAEWNIINSEYDIPNEISDGIVIHDDIRELEVITDFDNNGSENILIGNDGGVSLSLDAGQVG